ncbi:unnamed protein product [Lactuca saligna]|uniref:Uncharacterized protein n=1 Tax=Lactuca saligna TaxID=75948 RepID=A0AA36A3V6_LACSI|nr:unnamed protein product [Lactuca saligna]
MEKFQRSFESNTTKANEVIYSLGSTLKTEKVKLQEVRTGLTTNHAQFNYCISSQISKLQDNIAMERKIMDALAVKTEKEDPKGKKEANHFVKSESEPKGKEKLFTEEPMVDNNKDEELDEYELKRR